MKQSTKIFAAIIFAFIVYITVRGQLPDYLALFSGSKSSASSGGNADKTATSKPPAEKSFPEKVWDFWGANNNMVFGGFI